MNTILTRELNGLGKAECTRWSEGMLLSDVYNSSAILLRAPGEPFPDEKLQELASSFKESGWISSRVGPFPSGSTGHGKTSSYSTLSSNRSEKSYRLICSPLPLNPKSKEPYKFWTLGKSAEKETESCNKRMYSPGPILEFAGNVYLCSGSSSVK